MNQNELPPLTPQERRRFVFFILLSLPAFVLASAFLHPGGPECVFCDFSFDLVCDCCVDSEGRYVINYYSP